MRNRSSDKKISRSKKKKNSHGSDLHIEQIELHRISGVDVLVRVEELAAQQEDLVLVHPLLPEGPAVIEPVH